jgi:uncharacterized repeat protein (TIGR03803 family)
VRLLNPLILILVLFSSACGLGIDPFPDQFRPGKPAIGFDPFGFLSIYRFLGHSAGFEPGGHLRASNGLIYGITGSGGLNDAGTLYRLNPYRTGHTVLHHFDMRTGSDPLGAPVEWETKLYGLTEHGGTRSGGVLYRIDLTGGNYEVLHEFDFGSSGAPYQLVSGLVRNGDFLYIVGQAGGVHRLGGIFRYDLRTKSMATLSSFDETGATPTGNLVFWNGRVCTTLTLTGTDSWYSNCYRDSIPGDLFLGTLHTNPTLGQLPGALIVVGSDIYGVCQSGGDHGNGTIFRMDASLNLSIIHSFSEPLFDTKLPSSLILHEGHLYGATHQGGALGGGTLYRIRPDGSGYTRLHSFDGPQPPAALFLDQDRIRGETLSDGLSDYGTLFQWRLY